MAHEKVIYRLSDILTVGASESDDDRIAFIYDGFGKEPDNVTYKQLGRSMSQVSDALGQTGAQESRETHLFALYSHTWNREFYELFLGIIYARHAVFVIDYQWPKEYTRKLLAQIRPNFLISHDNQSYLDFLPGDFVLAKEQRNTWLNDLGYRIIELDRSPQIDDLATRLILPSTLSKGTTGSPKIIRVCHSSIVPNIIELSALFNLTAEDVFYQASSLTFDPCFIEIFCSIYSNAKLLVLPQVVKLLPKKICSYLLQNKASCLQMTPTLFRNVSEYLENRAGNVRTLVLGGERFPQKSPIIRDLIRRNVAVFNIYGITEMSCWSSCHRVTEADLDHVLGVPISGLLRQTEFYFRLEDKFVNLAALSDDDDTQRNLWHFSASRVCLTNEEDSNYKNSNDMVQVINGRVYFKGRNDRQAKINGKMTNLELIENCCQTIEWIESAQAMSINQNTSLVLIAIVKRGTSILDPKEYEHRENLIRKHLATELPSNFEPRSILLYESGNLPTTNHDKLNTRKMIDRLEIESKKFNSRFLRDPSQVLVEIWSDLLGVEPNESDNFVMNGGGDSLRAVKFIDQLEAEFPQIDLSKALDTLLNETFDSLVKLLESELKHTATAAEIADQLANPPEPKRSKLAEYPAKTRLDVSLEKDIVGWISKCTKCLSTEDCPEEVDHKSFQVAWKYDTGKCVDATPLVVIQANEAIRVYIGSHSKYFFCIEGTSGQLIWKFEANDLIESSATLSKCGNIVIVGSYDKSLYVLDARTGQLVWSIETGDVVKCSPTVSLSTGLIYFGSHDRNLYCIDIYSREVVWRIDLQAGSIFASPICCNDSNRLFVTTLGGVLARLDSLTGEVEWRMKFSKAIFTSPVIDESRECMFFGSCDGIFYCISFNAQQKWSFKTTEPIFSTACLVKSAPSVRDLILFGCHDNYLYCLDEETGQLIWRHDCRSQIYASPFVFNAAYSLRQIICNSSDGILFIFDLNGHKVLEDDPFSMKNSSFSSPIVHKRAVFIGCRNNHLYRIDMH